MRGEDDDDDEKPPTKVVLPLFNGGAWSVWEPSLCAGQEESSCGLKVRVRSGMQQRVPLKIRREPPSKTVAPARAVFGGRQLFRGTAVLSRTGQRLEAEILRDGLLGRPERFLTMSFGRPLLASRPRISSAGAKLHTLGRIVQPTIGLFEPSLPGRSWKESL